MRILPDRFQASSVTLKQLIVEAFEIKDYQLDGGPKWLTSDNFSINASAGGQATKAELHIMLKALLADRFALKTHIETRQLPTYALVVARTDGRLGPAIKPTPTECLQEIDARKNAPPQPRQPTTPPPERPSPRELPTTPICGNMQSVGRPNGSFTLLAGGRELREIVSLCSSEVAAPVVDRTGLTGLFTFTLEFTPKRNAARGLDPNSSDTPSPPLDVALEKQLGLKLEKQLNAQPIVVIDAAEHPTAD
jgi:uncharacterized protein (TIGR03435 family)